MDRKDGKQSGGQGSFPLTAEPRTGLGLPVPGAVLGSRTCPETKEDRKGRGQTAVCVVINPEKLTRGKQQ